MQVCTSLQTDNHASTPPLRFLRAGCPSCRPTNSVKALKAKNANTCAQILAVYRPTLHLCCFLPPLCYMLARVLAVAVCLSVCLCLSQIANVSNWLNESGWFWNGSFIRPIPRCVLRKYGYLRKKATFLWNLPHTEDLENFTAARQSSQRVHGRSLVFRFEG